MSLRSQIALFTLSCLACVASASDVNGDRSITYLVPISVPVVTPGAHGARWQSELWFYNGYSMPLLLGDCGSVSPPCGGAPAHAPGTTEQAGIGETFSTNGARVFELPQDVHVALSSRLFELSRHAQPSGVEMPVVREEQFLDGVSRFLAVPQSSGERVALRIYDPYPRSDSSLVRVEIVVSAQTIADFTMRLSTRQNSEPGFAAVYDLRTVVPELAGVERYDIRLTPLNAGLPYWALVSVTDEDTQQVLLISPAAGN